MPGRQRVTYEVACLFLLLWACLIAHQGVVVSARVRGNTTHLLQIRDRFRFFACCLLSFPAHGPSWDGGSWRGLHSTSARVALFESFSEWRSCCAHDKGSCEILQLFLTGIHHPYVSCTPHLCLSKIFLLNPRGCS